MNKALVCFNSGYNCSQAVFSTFCSRYGLDEDAALKIGCGFGAGMGRLGKTCGAVTGAYMVIGLAYGDDKEKTYEIVQEFSRRFIERHKTTDCLELLGVDLITGDQKLAAGRVNTICPDLVSDAADILEDILATY